MMTALQASRVALPLPMHLGDWVSRSRPLVVYKPCGMPFFSQNMIRRGSVDMDKTDDLSVVEDCLIHRVADSSPSGTRSFVALPQFDVGVLPSRQQQHSVLDLQNRRSLLYRGLTVVARRKEHCEFIHRAGSLGAIKSEYSVLCRVPKSVLRDTELVRLRDEARRVALSEKFVNPHVERHSLKLLEKRAEEQRRKQRAVLHTSFSQNGHDDVAVDPVLVGSGLFQISEGGELVTLQHRGRLEQFISRGLETTNEIAEEKERRLASLFHRSTSKSPSGGFRGTSHPWLMPDDRCAIRSAAFAATHASSPAGSSIRRSRCRSVTADFQLVETAGDLALYTVTMDGAGCERELRCLFAACGCPVVNDFEHDLTLAEEIKRIYDGILSAIKSDPSCPPLRMKVTEEGGPLIAVAAPLMCSQHAPSKFLRDMCSTFKTNKPSGATLMEAVACSSVDGLPFGMGIACTKISFPDPLSSSNIKLLQSIAAKDVMNGAVSGAAHASDQERRRLSALVANFQFLTSSIGGHPRSFAHLLEEASSLPSLAPTTPPSNDDDGAKRKKKKASGLDYHGIAVRFKEEEEGSLVCGKCGHAGHVSRVCTAVQPKQNARLQQLEEEVQAPLFPAAAAAPATAPATAEDEVVESDAVKARRALELLIKEERATSPVGDGVGVEKRREGRSATLAYALPMAAHSLVTTFRDGTPHGLLAHGGKHVEEVRDWPAKPPRPLRRCSFCHGTHHVAQCPRLEGGEKPMTMSSVDRSEFCIRCGQPGHIFSSCPQLAKLGFRTADFAMRCSICGSSKSSLRHDEETCPMRHTPPAGFDARGLKMQPDNKQGSLFGFIRHTPPAGLDARGSKMQPDNKQGSLFGFIRRQQ